MCVCVNHTHFLDSIWTAEKWGETSEVKIDKHWFGRWELGEFQYYVMLSLKYTLMDSCVSVGVDGCADRWVKCMMRNELANIWWLYEIKIYKKMMSNTKKAMLINNGYCEILEMLNYRWCYGIFLNRLIAIFKFYNYVIFFIKSI